jgi:Na+/H+ antiporter NhaC
VEEAPVRRSFSRRPAAAAAVLAVALLAASPSWAQAIEVEAPEIYLAGIPFSVTVRAVESLEPVDLELRSADGRVLAREIVEPLGAVQFREITIERREDLPLVLWAGADEFRLEGPLLPGWVTILPPIVAIALALIFHEVVTALFVGVWLGCFFLVGYNPLSALLLTIGRFARDALADPNHAAILIFSLLLGGMVGVLTRMGASRAIVDAVAPLATSRRRGQFATWAAGLVIFFDDYANTLIVGNTMRPLTDRLRISREKLAYIVDSTAAPVAAIVFVSTWVGYEIGLIEDGLVLALGGGDARPPVSAFAVFIHSIPYLFYPLLALLFVLLLIVMKREFGPMLAAERRAISGGGLFRPDAQLAASTGEIDEVTNERARWWMAAAPVAAVVVTVIAGLVYTGLEALPEGADRSLSTIFGRADPFRPLLWGSLVGCIAAVVLAVGWRLMKLTEAIRAWVDGLRSMLLAFVILMLAWSLGAVTESLGTASYLTTVLSDRLPLEALPFTTFVVAALISFATGTSWATMAILFPLVIPLAVALGAGMEPAAGSGYSMLLGSIAGVMAGSLFGDHCSPLSDTTVLSSMASGCDHVDHVRTQLPYALAAAVAASVAGTIPIGLGFSPWICLPVAAALLVLLVRFMGKPVESGGRS